MYRKKFMNWFEDQFPRIHVKPNMMATREDSPYHREANVWIHTNMVVREYVKDSPTVWSVSDLMGALMCAFHDTGKPMSEEQVERTDGSVYRRYNNHDTFSGNIFIDYFLTHRQFEVFDDITLQDAYNIWVMIAYHMPYKLNESRVKILHQHIKHHNLVDIFTRGVFADAKGRIADNQEKTEGSSLEWCQRFVSMDTPNIKVSNNTKTVDLLCGCSGIGKSTYASTRLDGNENTSHHSMDSLRLELYSNDYSNAFKMSNEDKEFGNKVMQDFIRKTKLSNYIIVDNTNLSWKRRRAYLSSSRDCKTKATVFMSPLTTVMERQAQRTDKKIPNDAVRRMYYSHRPAILGEVDSITLVG